jgi:hypothetical protein
MFYTVYKITNTLNQKTYIGAHKTYNLNDDYMGSGVAIRSAIRKYGKEHFIKQILYCCENESLMYELEKELVEVSDKTYNMTLGGKGGWNHIDSKGNNNPMRKSAETRAKVSEAIKKTKNDPSRKEFYDNIAKTNLKKAVERNRGKKRPEHSKLMKERGELKTKWQNHKEELRDMMSSTFEVISPEGIIYTTNRLEDFCKEHTIPYNTVWNVSNTGKSPKRGKAKGWKCKKISAP